MTRTRKTLLWEIQNHDSSRSFLFGTMHVRDAAAFSYFEAVKPFIHEAEIYAAEMDLNQATLEGQLEDALIPGGRTLIDFMSVKKYSKLRKILLKSFEIDLNQFLHVHPLFTTNMIAESILSKDHQEALDYAMWHFAEEAMKRMKGVESYADQLKTLKKLSVEPQIKQLIAIGRNPSKIRKTTAKMAAFYRNMDIQGMYKFSKKGMGSMRKTLIYNRNHFMVKSIRNLMKEGSCFFAIGAGHLAGQQGLIRLLRINHIQVRPIALQKSNPDNPL